MHKAAIAFCVFRPKKVKERTFCVAPLHLYEGHAHGEEGEPHHAVGDADHHLELAEEALLVTQEAARGHHVTKPNLPCKVNRKEGQPEGENKK